MGDSIMGLSTLLWLKKIYPKARIIYGLPSWIIPLYRNVSIPADDIINVDLKSAKDWWRVFKDVKKANPDRIHELHLAGRTSKFFNLFSKLTGVPYSFHNHHLSEKSEIHDQGVIKPLIQRDLDGAWSFLGEGSTLPRFQDFEPRMEVKGSKQEKDQVILGVVATRETKMWPLNYYVELAKKISSKVIIPLSKSEADSRIKEKLMSIGLPGNVEIIHESLSELPLILAGSRFYIGNDTGLKHLCIALGMGTFTFFGPEPPMEWHPYSKERHPYFYIDDLECRTREAHFCSLHHCDSMICLNQITVDEVLDTLERQSLI